MLRLPIAATVIRVCTGSIGVLLLLCGVALSAPPDRPYFPAVHLDEAPPPWVAEEIFLSFSYRGTNRVVITALYDEEKVYLPVTELFNVLMIPNNTDIKSLAITGTYLSEQQSYELHFNDLGNSRGRVGDREADFEAEDFLVGELDFYLLPEHFEKLFGLRFEVDMSNLTLSLQTDNVLPVVQRLERQRRRTQISDRLQQYKYYDLAYGRKRHFLRAGFLDYSINTLVSPTETNHYNYNLNVGGEFLGGDIQGTIIGGYNDVGGFSNFTDNLRWRYVPENRSIISNVTVGQVQSNGLRAQSNVRGIRISNENIQPQILFQDYVIDGHTVPESEVEIHINNSLVAFEEADMDGYYRFQVPLTYGTSQLDIRIYKPDGSVEIRNRRLQIPFTFLRSGQFQYNASVGQAESSLLSDTDQYWQGQATAAMGIAPWLTIKTGMDYLEADSSFQPLVYSSLSTRLGSNYLVNIDAAPQAYYRVNGSVVYSSAASVNLSYTRYVHERSLFNPTGVQENYSGNLYLPFSLLSRRLSLRLTGNYEQTTQRPNMQYRADLLGRFGRMNVRMSYRDRQTGIFHPEITANATVTTTATYIFPRGPTVSSLIKGLYLRSQIDYHPANQQINQAYFQLSKDLGRQIRLQLSVGRNFVTNQLRGQFNLTFDFSKVRSTSVGSVSGDRATLSQNLRGSVGYDGNFNKLYFSSRQQVGQAAASVRMYIDENSSGSYNEGEEILPYNAVRLLRSGRVEMDSEGITRVTQIQPYYRHNLEVNYAALRNPMYVPVMDEFSFIADPNQFKQIDIPFYITGILEGMVYQQVPEGRQPASGVRLYLISEDGQFEKTFNTFSDGSFYTYEVPPGKYNLIIDPSQLERINAESMPDTLDVTVDAVQEGDFISGLELTIVPQGTQRREILTAAAEDSTGDEVLTPVEVYGDYTHSVQLASYSTLENAEQALETASAQFNIPLTIKETDNLFAVRTLPIQSRQQAISLLLRISDSQFSQPVLVLTLPGDTAAEQPQESVETVRREVFSLQVGAFGSEQGAQRFASRISATLENPASVSYDSTRQLYKVYAESDPYGTLEEARRQLSQLRSREEFSGAFIDRRTIEQQVGGAPRAEADNRRFTYQVHVQGVSDISRERFLSAAITSDFNLLSNGPEEELVVFEEVADWQTAVDLTTKLRRIAGMGEPFIVMVEVEDNE